MDWCVHDRVWYITISAGKTGMAIGNVLVKRKAMDIRLRVKEKTVYNLDHKAYTNGSSEEKFERNSSKIQAKFKRNLTKFIANSKNLYVFGYVSEPF